MWLRTSIAPRIPSPLSSAARDRALRCDLRRLPRARFLGCPGAAVVILGHAGLNIMPLGKFRLRLFLLVVSRNY